MGQSADLDSMPEAKPDIYSFRPQTDHPHWVDLAMNDVACTVRSGALQPDWQRWTIIPDGDPLSVVYPPGLYFEGWSTAPQRMEPPHKEPRDFNFPLQYL